MTFRSVNPANGQLIEAFEAWDWPRIDEALDEASRAGPHWADLAVGEREDLLRSVAVMLRSRRDELATLITEEMGKLITESRGEIEKCAWVCDYYADHAADFLRDEFIETDAGRSLVAYQPLGTVLAVMPWNFPFWQVFRFLAPALAAGNTALLKHASNVPRCSQAIESVLHDAGVPQGVFQSLLISSHEVKDVIEDRRVQAVTLTGSVEAGRQVAAVAGAYIKKSVMELGGSDAFVVLEDADLDWVAEQAVASRYLNAGQSCIAAKRFIPVGAIADAFVERFKAAAARLEPGDPKDEQTRLAPMARPDLRDDLHQQVTDSVDQGAVPALGCEPAPGEGAYYKASILDHVAPGMRAYEEELFGPVAIVIRAENEADALRIANDSPFGLGGSVWTADSERGEAFARRMHCGAAFVNGIVKSDPRLPFGGVGDSGYGRELSHHGIQEFVNAKTLWVR